MGKVIHITDSADDYEAGGGGAVDENSRDLIDRSSSAAAALGVGDGKSSMEVVAKAPPTDEQSRINTDALSGLRAIASVHIMLGHYLYFGGVPVELMGGSAVTMFFVLSGFVMTLAQASQPIAAPIWDGRRKSRGAVPFDTKTFLWNRLVRVGPMYWITNTVCLPVAYYLNAGGSLMKLAVSAITSYCFAESWMSITPPNGLTWTISTMVGFWILSPFILPLAQRVPPRHRWYWVWGMYFIQCALYAIVFAEVSNVVDAYWWARAFPPIRLPVYLMGVFAGLNVVDPPTADPEADDADRISLASTCARSRIRRADDPGGNLTFKKTHRRSSSRLLADVYAAVFVIVVAVAAVGSSSLVLSEEDTPESIIEEYATTDESVESIGDSSRFLARCFMEMVLPIFYLGWILSLTGEPRVSATGAPTESFVGRFFRGRSMQFLGKISMSLYMVHLVIPQYVLVFAVMRKETRADPTAEAVLELYNDGGWPLWCIPIFVVSSLVLAYLSWRFVEVPCTLRFRRSAGQQSAASSAARAGRRPEATVSSLKPKPTAAGDHSNGRELTDGGQIASAGTHLPGAQMA